MSAFNNDYNVSEPPSKYAKFEDGDNVFRILSEAVTGWEYWVEENGKRSPRRVPTWKELPADRQTAEVWGTELAPKEFQAFKVLNRKNDQVQVLEVTQKSIMRGLVNLDRNKKWGDIREYDVNIIKNRTGSGKTDVEYSVQPEPKEALDEGIQTYCESVAVDVTALFRNEDPFQTATGQAGSINSSSNEDDKAYKQAEEIFEEEEEEEEFFLEQLATARDVS